MPRICIVNISGNIASGKSTLIEHCQLTTGTYFHNWDAILKYPEPVEDWNFDLKAYYDAMETGDCDKIIPAAVALQKTIHDSYSDMYSKIRERIFHLSSLRRDVLVIIERGPHDAARIFIPTIMERCPFMDEHNKNQLLDIKRRCLELDRFLKSDICRFECGMSLMHKIVSWQVRLLTDVDVCIERCNKRGCSITESYLRTLAMKEIQESQNQRFGTITIRPKPSMTPQEIATGVMITVTCPPNQIYIGELHSMLNETKTYKKEGQVWKVITPLY